MSAPFEWPDDLMFDELGRRRFCADCDAPLEQPASGRGKDFCSKRCADDHRRRRKRRRVSHFVPPSASAGGG